MYIHCKTFTKHIPSNKEKGLVYRVTVNAEICDYLIDTQIIDYFHLASCWVELGEGLLVVFSVLVVKSSKISLLLFFPTCCAFVFPQQSMPCWLKLVLFASNSNSHSVLRLREKNHHVSLQIDMEDFFLFYFYFDQVSMYQSHIQAAFINTSFVHNVI